MPFRNVEAAIREIAQGKMIILVDDEDRENEGDLCMAADLVTPEDVNFMACHGRGLVCLTLTSDKIRALGLPMMVEHNTSTYETGFTVSIEASEGVSTGISARDRARTILAAVSDKAVPADLVSPGHVFPIRARDGGVLVRTGQTEGSVDLARLAGRSAAGVICEIMNDDGSMARRPDLEAFAARHGLRIVTIAELIEYRLAHESLVETVQSRVFSATPWGEIELLVVRSKVDDREHLVIRKGVIDPAVPTLVRVQSVDLPADLLSFALTGCAEQNAALSAMAEAGSGVFVYLVRALGGMSLSEQLAHLGQESVHPTYDRVGSRLTLRDFGIGAQILKGVGVRRLRLMSNHDVRIVGLEGFDLEMVERVELPLSERRDGEGSQG
ncbi:MAG: 3,4-dihydroxy-2-butanone-4-phosphate synthase [Deltaproteobacteria bacterium]|nr:3,4-dihydroxy-2-butanone-4-phosphate synthase [Deltaproteobacteria bacterium]